MNPSIQIYPLDGYVFRTKEITTVIDPPSQHVLTLEDSYNKYCFIKLPLDVEWEEW